MGHGRSRGGTRQPASTGRRPDRATLRETLVPTPGVDLEGRTRALSSALGTSDHDGCRRVLERLVVHRERVETEMSPDGPRA